jgi:hypothetical protein
MLVFSNQVLRTIAPLIFSLVPLPPFQSQGTVYSDSVWLGGSGRVLSCVGDHSLQEFNILFDQIQNLRNCYNTPNEKPRRRGVRRQINTFRRVPFQVNFLENDIWHCFQSNLSATVCIKF